MICRQSSEPMEPPAPVTITTSIANAGFEQSGLRRHGIASQKIAHVDLANVLDVGLAGDELLELGHGLHVHAQRLERAQDLAPAPAGQRGQRQQNAVDVPVLDEVRQLIGRIDLDAVDHAAVQTSVVVDEHQTDRRRAWSRAPSTIARRLRRRHRWRPGPRSAECGASRSSSAPRNASPATYSSARQE